MLGHNSESVLDIDNKMIYDKDSNLIEAIEFGIGQDKSIVTSIVKYNRKGKEILRTDFYGDSTYYDYNNYGDMIKMWTSHNGETSYINKYDYEYNNKGKLIKTFKTSNGDQNADRELESAYEYDNSNRLTKVLNYDHSILNGYENYDYDSNGNLTKISYFKNDTLDYYETNQYDINGKLIETYLSSRQLRTTYTRNELNQIVYLEQYLDGEIWMKVSNKWNGKILTGETKYYYDTKDSNDHEGKDIIVYSQE